MIDSFDDELPLPENFTNPILDVAFDLMGKGAFTPKCGGRYYIASCPNHSDSHPSLAVWPHTGTWHCFACSTGGRVLQLAMFVRGYSRTDAIEYLTPEGGGLDELSRKLLTMESASFLPRKRGRIRKRWSEVLEDCSMAPWWRAARF